MTEMEGKAKQRSIKSKMSKRITHVLCKGKGIYEIWNKRKIK